MKPLYMLFAPFIVLGLFGCGGGASTAEAPTPVTPSPSSSSATLSGQWEIVVHSNANPASSALIEANFTQQGSTVTADTSSVVLIVGVPGAFTGLSGECDNGTLGHDSVQASISGQTASFTLTEAGSLGTGTSTGSGTISSDGTQITSGTYQTRAACGFAADSGSLSGTTIKPFAGTFSGQLLNLVGTTDPVVVTLSQSGYTLNAVGTDAGSPITLTGKAIGAAFDVTGVVQGQSREYFGVYDTTSNGFLVYDSKFQAIGTLSAQSSAPPPNPIAVSVSPSSATVMSGAQQIFTSTVANDLANKGVIWTISCAAANACGTISNVTTASEAPVTYIAPLTVPSPSTVTLKATSVADSTKSASATITVTAAPATIAGVSVICAPATITTSQTSDCSAVIAGTNSPSQAVTWTASVGTVSTSGVLTPPSIVSQTQVTITATSTADPTKSGTFVVTVNPVVPLNTAVFIGPGVLGGLSIDGSDARIAVNDVEVYLVTNGTSSSLPGHAVSMQGPDTLSFDDADNATYLDGVIQNEVLTSLPPTLYRGVPVWFDYAGRIQTPSGALFSGNETQDGINLQANGSLLTWVEETLPGGTTCQVWASVGGGTAQQITNVTYCAAGQQPLDAGAGHLFILWSGVNVAESRDNGASWIIGAPTNSQAVGGVAGGIANADEPTAGSTNIAYGNGTAYIVWQQRGDPQTVDDVNQGWLSKSTVPGQWIDAELLYPGTSARVGDFTPAVAGDGSDALFSLEQGNGGIILNSTLLVSNATTGPLIGLLPDGTRIVAWQDATGVWFEEVPK